MKKMSVSQQKLLKAIHLIFAGIWFSSVILIILLPLVSKKLTTGDELYMYNVIYHYIDMYVLTPACIATLLTGLIYSIFTKWGFIKHGWIIYKWVVTLLLAIIGTFYLGPMVAKILDIADVKRLAALQDQYYQQGGVIGIWAGVISSSLLIIAVFLSVYKPWKNLKN